MKNFNEFQVKEMSRILISYDLIKPDKNYSKLSDHLESYENYKRILESVWLIITDLTAQEVRDAADDYIDQDDQIFVVDITGKATAWRHLPDNVATWIKSNKK